ncbi:glycosyl transferase family 4 [Candidatus Pacearchaeota archaeon]|nr:glycosyl transferase family 4 [Candidatus Pacearchaeota archaeon]
MNILFIPILISFFVALFSANIWIKRAKKAGLTGKDMHKISKNQVAEAGGIFVLIAFILGVLSYIFIKTFKFGDSGNLVEIFSLLSSILIIGFIGFIDDILGWKIGMNKKARLGLLFFAAIPLMVINAGVSTMLGFEFGLFFPLVLIPLGIIGTSATFNFIAGYNGLEASQGIIILSALALVSWLNDNAWLSLILLCMISALVVFYLYNRCPAKVFPGDSLTYPIGALIGIAAILGNMEKIAVFFFIPYIIEVGLKSRGKLKKESFAKLNKDGSLDMPYKKFYGLEHIAIWLLKKIKISKKVYEFEVVSLINIFQIIIVFAGFCIFF